MQSSMRVQLTALETAPIFEAWAALMAECNNALEQEIEDASGMLDRISALNIATSAARSAIHTAWYNANKRAFPGPVPKRPSSALDLSALGITEDDVTSALEGLGINSDLLSPVQKE
jgi:hypothetical protein